jgi:hypothetical protein
VARGRLVLDSLRLDLTLGELPGREEQLLNILGHRVTPVLSSGVAGVADVGKGIARWQSYERGFEALLRQYPRDLTSFEMTYGERLNALLGVQAAKPPPPTSQHPPRDPALRPGRPRRPRPHATLTSAAYPAPAPLCHVHHRLMSFPAAQIDFRVPLNDITQQGAAANAANANNANAAAA